MASVSVENYLKAIWHLEQRSEDRVKTSDVADHLGLSLPSVTNMLKSLAHKDHLDYVPYQGVRLTSHGRATALLVIRKHRLLECFLKETLGLSWDEVHEEAELLEHALSNKLTDAIDGFLGYPTHDPHGDPIPTRDGSMPEAIGTKLAEASLGEPVVIHRVLSHSQDREFLQYLDRKGLVIGATVTVEAAEPFGGLLEIRVEGNHESVSISREVARVLVATRPEIEQTLD